MNALKTILWSIFVPGTLTTFVPFLIISKFENYSFELSYFRYFGIIPILFGVLLYSWCAWNFTFTGEGTPAPFDAPKKVVAIGAYKFVRNPMYVAVVTILLGEAIFFESPSLAVYALILFSIFHIWILIYEEPILRKKFGTSYEEYCGKISRWLPVKIK
ncbi:MAG: isoprenylcysteine carboxylmethyltransferase family protein [Pyrinomonadaceae bacterium]